MLVDFMATLYLSIPLSLGSIKNHLDHTVHTPAFQHLSRWIVPVYQLFTSHQIANSLQAGPFLISYPKLDISLWIFLPFPPSLISASAGHPLPHGSGSLCSNFPSSQGDTMVSCHSFLLRDISQNFSGIPQLCPHLCDQPLH